MEPRGALTRAQFGVVMKSTNRAIQFPTSVLPWPKKGLRRVSINSFGFGGTNAHVVIDDAYHYLQSRRLQARHNTVFSPETNNAANSCTSDGLQQAGSDKPQTKLALSYVFLLLGMTE
jgi:acyl transferase domain-containing protein